MIAQMVVRVFRFVSEIQYGKSEQTRNKCARKIAYEQRMKAIYSAVLGFTLISSLACAPATAASQTRTNPKLHPIAFKPIVKTDAEWKKLLSKDSYYILREAGTERAYSGAYSEFHKDGVFVCAGCALPIFDSTTKFDSGTGWPSFYQPYASNVVKEITDQTLGMARTEVKCARCGGHLGHVFDDGPQPTGLRYCINSPALKFVPRAIKR